MLCKLRIIDTALEIPGPLDILSVVVIVAVVSWWTQFGSSIVIFIPSVGLLVHVLGPTTRFDLSICCSTLSFGFTYLWNHLQSIGESGMV